MIFKLKDVVEDTYVGQLFICANHDVVLILAHHWAKDLDSYFLNVYSSHYNRVISIRTHLIENKVIIADDTTLELISDYITYTSVMGRRDLIKRVLENDFKS